MIHTPPPARQKDETEAGGRRERCRHCRNLVVKAYRCQGCQDWCCIECVNRHVPDSLPDALFQGIGAGQLKFNFHCPVCQPAFSFPQQLLQQQKAKKKSTSELTKWLKTVGVSEAALNYDPKAADVEKEEQEEENAVGGTPKPPPLPPLPPVPPLPQQLFLPPPALDPAAPLAAPAAPTPAGTLQDLLPFMQQLQLQQQQFMAQQQAQFQQTLLQAIQATGAATPPAPAAPAAAPYAPAPSNLTSTSGLRLPKTKLPTFSGERSEWPRFWASFDARVHSQALSPQVKFEYLVDALGDGKAARKIQGIAILGVNYDSAIARLKEAYGSDLALQEAVWRELYALKPIKGNLSNYEEVIDELAGKIATLRSLGVPEMTLNQYAFQWVEAQPHALTSEIHRSRIQAGTQDQPWTIAELIKLLNSFIQLFTARTSKAKDSNSKAEDKVVTATKTSDITASASGVTLFANKGKHKESQAREKEKFKGKKWLHGKSCPFCSSKNHDVFNCDQYNTPAKRRAVVEEKGLCFNCLRQHGVADCQISR